MLYAYSVNIISCNLLSFLLLLYQIKFGGYFLLIDRLTEIEAFLL